MSKNGLEFVFKKSIKIVSLKKPSTRIRIFRAAAPWLSAILLGSWSDPTKLLYQVRDQSFTGRLNCKTPRAPAMTNLYLTWITTHKKPFWVPPAANSAGWNVCAERERGEDKPRRQAGCGWLFVHSLDPCQLSCQHSTYTQIWGSFRVQTQIWATAIVGSGLGWAILNWIGRRANDGLPRKILDTATLLAS